MLIGVLVLILCTVLTIAGPYLLMVHLQRTALIRDLVCSKPLGSELPWSRCSAPCSWCATMEQFEREEATQRQPGPAMGPYRSDPMADLPEGDDSKCVTITVVMADLPEGDDSKCVTITVVSRDSAEARRIIAGLQRLGVHVGDDVLEAANNLDA